MRRHLVNATAVLMLSLGTAGVGQEAPEYDLLLKGGHVIDPANQISGVRDVAISGTSIARVAPDIPASSAGKLIDVTGLYVTPGYVDMHVHVYYTIWPHSLKPEDNTLSSGTTTIVDCGSSGWANFRDFKKSVIDETRVRVLAFLNIESLGLAGVREPGVNMEEMNPDITASVARQYSDCIVGIKLKSGRARIPWSSLDRATRAAELAGIPVVVDYWPMMRSFAEQPYDDLVLKHMRPGDIQTHIFSQRFPVILPGGALNPVLKAAQERGVLFDVGHGQASFWFPNAVPAIQQGFLPNTISTDLHRGTVHGPAIDMLTVMSKFLVMGVPLEDVVKMATLAPARAIHRPDLGTLSEGAEADIAVIEQRQGQFGYTDCGRVAGPDGQPWRGDRERSRFIGDRKLKARLTFRAGQIVFDPDGRALPDWKTVTGFPGRRPSER